MKKKMIMSTDEYVLFNKRILKIVGLHPINLLQYLACLFTMLLILVPQIFHLYLGRNDLSVILDTGAVFLTVVFTIVKSLVWLWNTETSRVVEFLLTDHWRIAESIDMNNRMEGYAKSGRNITRGYSFVMINTLIVFYTLQPLKAAVIKLRGNYEENVYEQKTFPFPATYPKFCYESPFYEITYGSQIVSTGICCLIILAMDTIIATALIHICGHFKILHDNVLNLDRYIEQVEYAENMKIRKTSKYSKAVSMNLKKRVATLVNHHQLVIRFSDCMEKAFNPLILLQVLASSLVICLVGLQVSSTVSTSYRPVEYCFYFIVTLFHNVLVCWPGGEMILHSSMIGDAAFSINWYNASTQLKMEISFIILRSQKPNCLTAGKFHTMSMKYFGVMLSTSWSYLMLLRSVNSK